MAQQSSSERWGSENVKQVSLKQFAESAGDSLSDFDHSLWLMALARPPKHSQGNRPPVFESCSQSGESDKN